ncbi:hypothetical protein F511_13424 [Dorcoceras hygrometricum]|uniref:Uncharacterized protein n=1 Tax=Dorcoceras hygrometricum TaxID=472368 RepID=A0A2Z7A884_9LAMI|nr:hypothetical protein F511_13424 [Dorcoceras hygrometricum]
MTCTRLESTSLDDSSDDVPQIRYSADNQQALDTPRVDIPNEQTDLTGNIEVIDLTNVDQVQEQIVTSVPTASFEPTIGQDDALADHTKHQVISRPVLDTQCDQNEDVQPDIQEEQGANPIGSDLRWNRNHSPEQIIGESEDNSKVFLWRSTLVFFELYELLRMASTDSKLEND